MMIEELGNDFRYEGWIIVDGSPVSTGVFSSVTFPKSFTVDATQLAAATTFVLSIEPAVDSDPAPAATKILAGDFSGSSANVGLAPVIANGDLNTSSGTFFLRTPTDELPNSNNGNDQNGVWFGIPGAPVPGEDFFNNAPSGFSFPLDVRGRTVVISIEPSPDNSPAPFAIKPLVGNAVQETAPSTHSLDVNIASFPAGSVSR